MVAVRTRILYSYLYFPVLKIGKTKPRYYSCTRGYKPWRYTIIKNGAYIYIIPFQQIDKYNKIIVSHFGSLDFAFYITQMLVVAADWLLARQLWWVNRWP